MTCRYLFFFLTLIFSVADCKSQTNPIVFQKHGIKYNTLAGHQWIYEVPVEVGRVIGSDDFDSLDAKHPTFFGACFKVGLKNKMDRGIAVGAGFDWSTNNYFRIKFALDLDFLLHVFTEVGVKEHRFGGSFLSKWAFSSVLAEREGVKIHEYYLQINFMQMHFRGMTFFIALNKGVLRKKYAPYFADGGLVYGLSFTFRK